MSMGPLHGAVLAAAGLVSSPALWLTLVEGTLPLGDALIRFLVSVVICWAALNLVAQMVGPRSAPVRVAGAEPGDDAEA